MSAKYFEYMDVHTKRTEEEMKQLDTTKRNTKGDNTRKETITIVADKKDILFGIWANVTNKSQFGNSLNFGNYTAQLPSKQSSMALVMRTLWTSYDYLTADKI